MKKILLFACLLLMAITSIASAAQPITVKPRVAVLFQNNAQTTYDDVVEVFVTNNLTRIISPYKYDYVDATQALKRLNEMGITDLSTAERSDIVNGLDGLGIDYLVFMEVQPLVRKTKFHTFVHGIEMTAQAPFKIIDVVNNKYQYQGKFVAKGTTGTILAPFTLLLGNKKATFDALSKVMGKVAIVVEERMPAT